ncbi:MAG: DUF58 domain-containing protein [Actinomycetota bacterium]
MSKPRVKLTTRGRGMVGSGVTLSAAAMILRVSELYVVAFAALVLPLVLVWRARLLARRIELEADLVSVPRRPEVGRGLAIRITLRAHTRVTAPLIVGVDAPFAAGKTSTLVTSLIRGTSTVIDLRAIAVRRGRADLGPVRIRLPDGLGVVDASWHVGASREVLVLPSFSPIRELPTLPAEESGGGAKRSTQRGTEFHSLRGYQKGDDLRQVHWRASAKHDSLMIRDNEPLSLPRITVILDDRDTAHLNNDTLEWAVSAAASVISGAGSHGFGVRLVTSDGRPGKVRYGRAATDQLIERLAVVSRSGARDLDAGVAAAATTGRGGAMVAILTPRLNPTALSGLLGLGKRQGWAAAIIVDDGDAATADTIGGRLIAAGWKVVRVRPGRHGIEAAWKTLLERTRVRA